MFNSVYIDNLNGWHCYISMFTNILLIKHYSRENIFPILIIQIRIYNLVAITRLRVAYLVLQLMLKTETGIIKPQNGSLHKLVRLVNLRDKLQGTWDKHRLEKQYIRPCSG